ncbi:hypothetical protein [Demequina sp. NBRC 110051]|uniref:hypothetical protein n=1 Tax=Demequina sp. NBRC 110051 TaxID=1570340 RepID=UPI00117FC305|nr:hypothetical protein [Demequina sp. NBRC 110051]
MQDTDTLGRWIAHYLAERLESLGELAGEELAVAEREVADLVLRLWAQRRDLPTARPVLAAVDRVDRALERLDHDREPWGFFGVFDDAPVPEGSEVEADAALKVALELDRSAGDLVRSLIGYAASIAREHDGAWVEHAEKIGERAVLRQAALHVQSPAGEQGDNTTQTHERNVLARAGYVRKLLDVLEAAMNNEESE